MKKYSSKDFTYGAELEYADVYRFNKLPEGCKWNERDYSIVNSNGIANDPKGELWKFGGEINTRPTNTIDEQVEVIKEINGLLYPRPTINYKCNLHIHIGVPGLDEDIEACKKLLRYIDKYGREAFEIADNLPIVKRQDFENEEAYKGAKKRLQRNKVSHQQMLPKDRVTEALNATTIKGFFLAHAPQDKYGNRSWFIAPRPGINLRQLQETKTVEFRHFYQTLNLDEIRSCFIWCREFMDSALNSQKRPKDIIAEYPNLSFPTPVKYDHGLHTLFKKTNLDKNSREKVKEELKKLIKYHNILFVCVGNINRSPACQVIMEHLNNLINIDSACLSDKNGGLITSKRMIQALEEKGVDYLEIRSKFRTTEIINWADVIFYMDNANYKRLNEQFGKNPKYVPIVKYSSNSIGKIPDPHFFKGIEMHKKVVDLVFDCCQNIVKELNEMQGDSCKVNLGRWINDE